MSTETGGLVGYEFADVGAVPERIGSLKAPDVPREPPLPAGRTQFVRANLVERVGMAWSPRAKARRLDPREARRLPSATARLRDARRPDCSGPYGPQTGGGCSDPTVRPGPTAATAFCARSWNSRGGSAKLGLG